MLVSSYWTAACRTFTAVLLQRGCWVSVLVMRNHGCRFWWFCSSQHDAVCPYPLVSSFSAGIVLLGKVPQVVVVVEVEKLNEVLEWNEWQIHQKNEYVWHFFLVTGSCKSNISEGNYTQKEIWFHLDRLIDSCTLTCSVYCDQYPCLASRSSLIKHFKQVQSIIK